MSNIQIKTDVKITATIELVEGHLRALDALALYGDDAFLKMFYDKLGKSYLKPLENDVRELFTMIRSDVQDALKGVAKAREELGAVKSC